MSAISLVFDNRALRLLPPDRTAKAAELFSSRLVRGASYAIAKTTPLLRPVLVSHAPAALSLIGIDVAATVSPAHADQLAVYFSGNKMFEGSELYAHCYAGFQFGSFAGQLGDGAAISLGEVLHHQQRNEVQLKGAGPTAFSRQSDGRKVLRSSIREYLCSELMHHLGIPTTRAGALVTSDSTVTRDPLYNGKNIDERCSVCTRIAPTFLRFGSFEVCRVAEDEGDRDGPSAGLPHVLQSLLDYTVSSFFPGVVENVRKTYAGDQDLKEAVTVAVFAEVVQRTAHLVAEWHTVGFCHGVLNTDNMSIVGLTLDYGPFAFMAYFSDAFVPNLSDHTGRYAFGQQARMAKWNLEKLAEAFALVYPTLETDLLDVVKTQFESAHQEHLTRKTSRMLGLGGGAESTVKKFYEVLQATRANAQKVLQALMQNFPLAVRFYDLPKEERLAYWMNHFDGVAANIAATCCAPPSVVHVESVKLVRSLAPQLPKHQIEPLRQLLESSEAKARDVFQGASRISIQTFLDQQMDQWRRYEGAMETAHLYKDMPLASKRRIDEVQWKAFLAEYANDLAGTHQTLDSAMVAHAAMRQSIPQFLLYPWVLEDAIRKAEQRDFSLVRELADRVCRPYDTDPRDGTLWSMEPPDNASDYLCSCSS